MKVKSFKKSFFLARYTIKEFFIIIILQFRLILQCSRYNNRIVLMNEDNVPSKEKMKYQLIYHSIQERLNEILESPKCSLKVIKIDPDQFNYQENVMNQQEPVRMKSCKKVMFQSIFATEKRKSTNKNKVNMPTTLLKSRKSIIPNNGKSYKSLNCSFAAGLTKTQSKSNRSIRTQNSELPEARKYVSQILKKFTIFFNTQITQKQIIEWLHSYCQKDHSILLKLFLKIRKLSCHKSGKVKQVCTLELDEDVLHARLELKLKDGLGNQRYVPAHELQNLSIFLENSFVDKMRIKTKEFEDSIAFKMRSMCQKIRKEDDNEYILNVRKKPVQISDFLVDVNHFQSSFGALKKISTLNRIRFKMLNDTDLIINRHVKDINDESQITKKRQSITFVS